MTTDFCDYRESCRIFYYSADLCKKSIKDCEFYKVHLQLKRLEEHPLVLVLDTDGSLERSVE